MRLPTTSWSCCGDCATRHLQKGRPLSNRRLWETGLPTHSPLSSDPGDSSSYTLLLGVWIAANAWAWLSRWDPYPFILLNLVLSFQAAYTAPIIMMSQNRQAATDRLNAQIDYQV